MGVFRVETDLLKDNPDLVFVEFAVNDGGLAIEEGRAVTVPEALTAVENRLKSLNADVQVEQEEYDEVVVIKAMFLNHDYQ